MAPADFSPWHYLLPPLLTFWPSFSPIIRPLPSPRASSLRCSLLSARHLSSPAYSNPQPRSCPWFFSSSAQPVSKASVSRSIPNPTAACRHASPSRPLLLPQRLQGPLIWSHRHHSYSLMFPFLLAHWSVCGIPLSPRRVKPGLPVRPARPCVIFPPGPPPWPRLLSLSPACCPQPLRLQFSSAPRPMPAPAFALALPSAWDTPPRCPRGSLLPFTQVAAPVLALQGGLHVPLS